MSDAKFSSIRTALETGLSPVTLDLLDESDKHKGHMGAHHDAKGAHRDDGGITHLRVKVVAPAFTGKSRVERHRLVNDLLQGEIAKGLHAIAIEAKAPGE